MGGGVGGLVIQILRREGVSKNNFLGPLGFLYIYIYIIYISIYIYLFFLFLVFGFFCSKNKYSMKGENMPKSLIVYTYIRFQIFSRFSDCFILIHYLQNIKIN